MSPRILIGALVAVVLVSGCGSAEGAARLSGMVRTPTPTIAVPELSDDTGRPVSFAAPADGLALVYFGYTNCPDVCPTTLADLRAALKELGDGATDRVALSFVTVDPERDTSETLVGYVRSFLADADAVRISDRSELQRLGDVFGATFGRTEATDGSVEISHSAFLYALDGDGRLLVQWPFGTTRRELTTDLALLLDLQESS